MSLTDQEYGREVAALSQIIGIYRIAQTQEAAQHYDRLTEIYMVARRALDRDSDSAFFGYLLRQLIDEARSHDGVTGPTARAARLFADRVEAQVQAFRRIMAELSDDGITEESLQLAEKSLGS